MNTFILTPLPPKLNEPLLLYNLRRSFIEAIDDGLSRFIWMAASESERMQIAKDFDMEPSEVRELISIHFPDNPDDNIPFSGLAGPISSIAEELNRWVSQLPSAPMQEGAFLVAVDEIHISVTLTHKSEQLTFLIAPHATLPNDVVVRAFPNLRTIDDHFAYYYPYK